MEQQYSNFRWVVLALLFMSNFLDVFSMFVMPPLFMEISDQIPLTKTLMGLSMGIAMLSGVVFGPLGGGISDRIGCRWGVGIGRFLVAGGSALRGCVESPVGIIVGMFLIGAGFHIAEPAVPKALSIWFPKKRVGFANGLCLSGLAIGGSIAMAISANFLSPALGGWRGVMLFTGGLSFFNGIIWILLYKDRKKEVPVDETAEKSIDEKSHSMLDIFRKVFKVRAVWLLSLFFGVHLLGNTPVVTFLPISLQEQGVERAGELVSILSGVIFVFIILGGIISDKLGRRKPLLMLGTAVGGLSVMFFPLLSGIPFIIALITCGAGVGIIMPVLFIMPAEMKEIGPELTATVIGVFLMLEALGGFLGPILAGKLIDLTGSYLIPYISMGATLIVAAVFCIPIKDTGSKRR